MDITPKVSVCIFTYNYEKYLAEAIESVLMQQTSFPIEIVIGDDLSTDKTRDIAVAYHAKYPEIIKLSLNESNIGGTRNWIKTINTCKGTYIALLDGDDYFSDPLKLQKQADLMDSDKKCVLSFHAVNEVNQNDKSLSKIIRFENRRYDIEYFLKQGWFIRTSTTMFRNGLAPINPPEWVYKFPYRYDTILHVFLGIHGHASYLDEVMSIWRKHDNGLSNQFGVDIVKNVATEVAMAKELDQYSGFKYKSVVKKYCTGLYSGLLIHLLRKGLWVKHFKLTLSLFFKSDITLFFSSLKRKFSA